MKALPATSASVAAALAFCSGTLLFGESFVTGFVVALFLTSFIVLWPIVVAARIVNQRHKFRLIRDLKQSDPRSQDLVLSLLDQQTRREFLKALGRYGN